MGCDDMRVSSKLQTTAAWSAIDGAPSHPSLHYPHYTLNVQPEALKPEGPQRMSWGAEGILTDPNCKGFLVLANLGFIRQKGRATSTNGLKSTA